MQLKRLAFPLRIALGVALLVFLLSHADLQALRILGAVQAFSTGLVAAVLTAVIWFEALRLYYLSGRMHGKWQTLQIVLIAQFITNFTPSSIGGDGYKVYRIAKDGRYASATAIVILERSIGLAVLLTGSAVFAILYGGAWVDSYLAVGAGVQTASLWNPVTQLISGVLLFTGVTCVLLFRRWIRHVGSEFFRALHDLPMRTLCAAIATSAATHTSKALLLSLMLVLIGEDIGFSQAWVVLTFTSVVALIPVSIGGLGLREAAFVVGLQPFGVASAPALLAGLVFRLVSIVHAALGGFLFTRVRSQGARAPG